MFLRPTSKTLRLAVEGHVRTFASSSDFDFALSGRTGLPGKRVAAMLSQTRGDLIRDAENIRRIALRITQIVSGTPSETANLTGFLLGLDRSLISSDHGWREVLGALAQYDSSTDEYKRIALVKYGQYLTTREDTARALFATLGGTGEETPVPSGISSTLIVDVADSGPANSAFDRLPKGETIEIALDADESLPLMLVKHPCEIVGGPNPLFVDSSGNRTVLRVGRTIVGRDSRSDIRISTGRRDISRRHLIVESGEGSIFRLTDVSSLGTFVPPRYLDKTGS